MQRLTSIATRSHHLDPLSSPLPRCHVSWECLACSATSISSTVDHRRAPLSEDTERTRGAKTSSMRNFMVLGQRFSRSLSTSSRVHLQNRVLEKQKIFQADNDMPVHLKGGQGDLILYKITMGISIVGSFLGVFHIVKASLAKK
ncbi:cytochrome c oxidase subunit 7A2, mitochondrial-like isoform X2 [Rana temporaria]|uniref:cytochrome c oxidase subunit 7A2, mitochondrial-like isoform X2 n=1 Tax=Rana temporaria TaxID=8407 RepID=UPI001AAD781A|nr:cytochrome c oxidase subunit 7A2, mitochondrial-like isoform X2 [Rana temporaria]